MAQGYKIAHSLKLLLIGRFVGEEQLSPAQTHSSFLRLYRMGWRQLYFVSDCIIVRLSLTLAALLCSWKGTKQHFSFLNCSERNVQCSQFWQT